MKLKKVGKHSNGTKNVVFDIGRTLPKFTDDQRMTLFIIQILSSAVQSGKVVSVVRGEKGRQ